MNLVIITGKVISKMEYKFVYEGKKKAKVSFKLRLENNNITDVFAYDNMADKIYQEVQQNDTINIIGKVHSNMKVECK